MDRPETVHIRSNGQVTLPMPVRRAAELQEGDVVEVVLQDDGTILLRPVAVLDRLQADLVYRVGARSEPELTEDDIRERARGLVRRRRLPVTTGRALDALVERYQRGDLTQRAFISEALMLGLPSASITALVAGTEPAPAEAPPAPPVAEEAPQAPVRIAQAYHSLLYLPLYIAHDVGFFEDEGVRVEITTAGGGTEAWSAVEAGVADYSAHDPVFTVRAFEQGIEDAVVVGSICNGQAILALAADPAVEATDDPRVLSTRTVAGRTVATQPQPDSQWALLRYLQFLYQAGPESSYRGLQVPIGTEPASVLAGQADICLAFPPQADVAMSQGLHEVFDFSSFLGPYLLSALATRRGTVQDKPAQHKAVITALEKACQYAHAFPDEAVRVAQLEFPGVDPKVIESATRRCLRRNFLPPHIAVDREAWQENGVLNRFVGTIQQYHSSAELVDNEMSLHVYRTLGNLRLVWDGPRPIGKPVAVAGA
ncbi:ABC transporter substrate-binding protein [Actinacidiphila soli]|uniref:ABC transporter substrate-binding protein n=1 Tax=Actinacidiphila soli TaxID=2487275 RepID=UPI000FCB23CC|nr:ABC transporter substrate-binding protein [Actinacidiphila soli]